MSETIALVDQAYPELRKEIMMSIVEQEAQRVVEDAIQDGASAAESTDANPEVMDADSVESAVSSTDLPEGIEEALTQAEQNLAAVASVDDTPTVAEGDAMLDAMEEAVADSESADEQIPSEAQDESTTDEAEAVDERQKAITESTGSVSAETSSSVENVAAEPTDFSADEDPETSAKAAEEPTASVGDVTDADAPEATQATDESNAPLTETTGPDAFAGECVAEANEAIADTSPAADDLGVNDPSQNETIGSSTSPDECSGEAVPEPMPSKLDPQCDQINEIAVESSPADPVPHAIEQIEVGIQQLSALLSREVQAQSGQTVAARQAGNRALGDIVDFQAQAQRLLDEMVQLKEQAAIARSEADVAWREAKLCREGARRAQQRAEASANAAEQAADRAMSEAQAAGDPHA